MGVRGDNESTAFGDGSLVNNTIGEFNTSIWVQNQ
jgi:hypothetical protein